MSIKLERKIELNEWLISVKWFYGTAIFLIAAFLDFGINRSFYSHSLYLLAFLFLAFILVNFISHFALKWIKKTKAVRLLRIFSIFQVILELLFIFLIALAIGTASLVSIFFFFPIIFSIVALELSSAIWTILLSVSLISYLNFSNSSFNDVASSSFIASEKIIFLVSFAITSFIIVRLIKFLINQDNGFLSKAEELEKVSEYRKNEWMQLQKTSQLLVSKEKEVTAKNEDLDKKIKDLERSEKSMLTVFGDLKKEREKTEEEKTKTEAIISNLVDPIILINANNEISLFNPSAREIFGFDESSLGKKIPIESDLSMKDFKPFTKYEYNIKTSKELKLQDPTEEEVSIEHTGNELTYKVITVEVSDKRGNNLGVMKIFSNLTREKTLDKMKSDFISIAAHQLRTPLSAIKWAIKMVLDGDTGKLNEEQSGMLLKGYKSNERIIELVNDMLDVSRIEEGRFGYSFGDGDFLKELDFIIDSLQGKIKEKVINLVVNKPDILPPIFMDRQRMTLVLQNLIENAVKYTPDRGKVEITLEVEGDFLKTKIKDSGVGIPEEDQKKIFSKFFRAGNVMRMQTEGSGLGLFIVKNIINKHGGDITFDSDEGIGTEFVFTLPLKKEEK